MAELITADREICLVVYRQEDQIVRQIKKSLSEKGKEIQRNSLTPTKIYTIGRETPVSHPDISIEDPYVSKRQATIYVPTIRERLREGRDYIIFTNIGKNSPSRISLSRGHMRPTESNLINTVVESLEVRNRRRDIETGKSAVLYMGEEIGFGPYSLIFTTNSN